MARAASEFEEVFTAGGTRFYSVYYLCDSDEMPPAIGSVLLHQSDELTVVLSIECANHQPNDNDQRIKGSRWCLILSDDNTVLNPAISQSRIDHIKSRFSKFSDLLEGYLAENSLIPVSVSFESKDEFKACFPGRTSWDAKHKQWLLRHISEDFGELKQSSDVTSAIFGNLLILHVNFSGTLSEETKAKFNFSYIPHHRLRHHSLGFKSLQETIDELEK